MSLENLHRLPHVLLELDDGNGTVRGTAREHETVLVRRPAHRVDARIVLAVLVGLLPLAVDLLPDDNFPSKKLVAV